MPESTVAVPHPPSCACADCVNPHDMRAFTDACNTDPGFLPRTSRCIRVIEAVEAQVADGRAPPVVPLRVLIACVGAPVHVHAVCGHSNGTLILSAGGSTHSMVFPTPVMLSPPPRIVLSPK